MESTQLIESIEKIKQTYVDRKPPTDMEIVRHAIVSQLARMNEVEIPPLLSEEQRQAFIDNADKVSEFLRTEDGADSVELVVSSFRSFCESYAAAEPVTEVVIDPATGLAIQ